LGVRREREDFDRELRIEEEGRHPGKRERNIKA
jgi:hypothetical protein